MSEGSHSVGHILSLVPVDFGGAVRISTGGRSVFIPSRGAASHRHLETGGWHLFLQPLENLPPPWCPQGSQSLVLCFWVTFFISEVSLGSAAEVTVMLWSFCVKYLLFSHSRFGDPVHKDSLIRLLFSGLDTVNILTLPR